MHRKSIASVRKTRGFMVLVDMWQNSFIEKVYFLQEEESKLKRYFGSCGDVTPPFLFYLLELMALWCFDKISFAISHKNFSFQK